MSSISRVNAGSVSFSLGNEQDLIQALESLDVKKQSLLAEQQKIQQSLNEIKMQEDAIRAQIQKIQAIPPQPENPPIQVVESAQKVATFVGTTLVINPAQIIKTRDSNGEREHYSVTLITEQNEKVEINKWPVDIKKYGEIKQIVILGEKETVLKTDEHPITARLVKYLSTGFDAFRKEINKKHVDPNGQYPNKSYDFECQRFAYYLRRGEEGYFGYLRTSESTNYREGEPEHSPFCTYGMKGETIGFGAGGSYKGEDISKHYYTCLTDQVCVSKYGKTDVLFTSYQQILDAYFPAKFVRGSRWEEW